MIDFASRAMRGLCNLAARAPRSTACLAAVVIPLGSHEGWQDLKFSKIKPNVNVFSSAGLEVAVDSSSSPLIFPLKEAVAVSGFRAELEIDGAMVAAGGGSKADSTAFVSYFPEDAYLRLGLVVPGKRRLNMMERMVAAEWVKKLFSLAPKDGGVDKIYFFNLVAGEPGLQGRRRVFPGSKDLMQENIVLVRRPDQAKLVFEHTIAQPLLAAALWLSVDGDDTKSKYKLRIKKLDLNPTK